MPTFTFTLNGSTTTVTSPADRPLLWVLRDMLGVTGPKYGCGVGVCKACTSHLDGERLQPVHHGDRRVRRTRGHHDRGVGRRRHAPSRATGLDRRGRRAMWVLPARPDHGGGRAPRPQPGADGRRHRRHRQRVPVWHLLPDPQRDPPRRWSLSGFLNASTTAAARVNTLFQCSGTRVGPFEPLRRSVHAGQDPLGTHTRVSVREGGTDVEVQGEHLDQRARTRGGDHCFAGLRVADGHGRARGDTDVHRGGQCPPGVRHRSRTFRPDVVGEQRGSGRRVPEGRLARWSAVPERRSGHRLPRAPGLRRGAVGEDHRSLRERGAVGSRDLRPDDPEQRLHLSHHP